MNLHVLAGRHVYPARLVAAALVLPILLLGGLVGLDYWVLEPSLPSVVSHVALLAIGAAGVLAFSVAADALGNVARHARARHAALSLRRENDMVVLEVIDDGVGDDPASSVGGLGLRNMRERAFNAGGRLVLTSKPGAGTRLQMRIPVQMGVVA